MAAATIRLGKISSINYTAGKARVVYEDRDDSVTSELPFLALQYNIPKVDDLVVVACFSNGTVSGVILGPVYNSANTPHEGGAGIFRQEMSNNVNEAVVSYSEKKQTIILRAPKIEFEGYGEFLDNLGAGRGVTRKQPAPAETTLRFTLSEKRPAAVGIPEGTKVTDGNLNYFATVGYEEIPAGETYVDVRALCTENGVDGNELLPGQVNVLVDLIPYVESVSNTTKTSGGADLESDESLAERIFLAPSGYSVAGPDDAYKYWTKTYSQTIGDVKVTSPNPVEVEIRFIMTNGELPTKTVIDGVAAYLQDENIRPLTDKVTVLAPETVKFNIAFTYYVNLSDQSKAGTIQAEVAQAVADYIEWQTRTIGRDINPSELMKRIVAAGAKRAEITSPVFTTVPDTSVARIETQTVTYGGVEND